MTTITEQSTRLKGAEFLLRDSGVENVFIPEEMNEEHRMVAKSMKEFIKQEIKPAWKRLEKQEDGLSKDLMQKLAHLGVLGVHIPEKFGGLEMDFIVDTIIAEMAGPSGGFSVTVTAHTGIGMLPILYFGTDEQKQKYLPKLITGEYIGSYCLTEPSSGSDALAAKSTAVLSEDGKHYILNGQKMWITNAGFADVFTVFAKVDGEKFTGFILERGMDGFTLGEEEEKMGIKSSSTRQIYFENVKVPVENLLGEVGKGHLIAFNVLNTGRYKLGVACLGGSKELANISIDYANERHQFNKPIASFGAIQYKLAEQATKIFTTESVIYRLAGKMKDWSQKLIEEGVPYGRAKLEAAKEYALECSIVKILGSESLDYIVDEAVQIFGGMGFSEEGYVAQAYRDARINRIFEGTNEINRLLLVSMILKKAMKGQMDIATPAMKVKEELKQGLNGHHLPEGKFGDEILAIHKFKKVLFMVLGSAAKLAMEGKLNLLEEQQINTHISDIISDIYAAESLMLRVRKMQEFGKCKHPEEVYDAMLKTFVYDANDRIAKNAKDAIASFVKPELQAAFMDGVRRFTDYPMQNVRDLRRTIAKTLIEKNEYCF